MDDGLTLSGTEDLFPLKKGAPSHYEVLRRVENLFHSAGIPDWAKSAEWLVTEALQVSRTELFGRSGQPSLPSELALLAGWVERRLTREPVQYIVGQTEFYGLRLRVDPRVLIPRPETELLAERVVHLAALSEPPCRILDIGTGSGCIALAVASSVPGAEVVGTDYSEAVLELARENAETLALPVSWSKWDLLNDSNAPPLGRFSIIVSNPPYIPIAEEAALMPEVGLYEPHAALFVDGDPLLFYRTILAAGDTLLEPGGHVFFETNPDFAAEVEELMRSAYGYVWAGVEQDLGGYPRIVWGRRDG